MIQIIGHRGAPAARPENTLTSFAHAKALGATGIECDVRACRSGDPYLLHDPTLERTTNGAGAIADTGPQVLAGLDAGAWFNPAFAGEAVPSLREVVELATRLDLRLNIEIKASDPLTPAAFARRCVAIIRAHANPVSPPPLISSFAPDLLDAFAALTSWPTMRLVKDAIPDTITTPLMGIHWDLVSALARREDHGRRWVVWGLDRRDDIARCLRHPIAAHRLWGVITDHPDEALRHRSS
ncbi:MAG: glycerophosphodiester phosphodiesterase family protein [Pseudomonadota bacterium]